MIKCVLIIMISTVNGMPRKQFTDTYIIRPMQIILNPIYFSLAADDVGLPFNFIVHILWLGILAIESVGLAVSFLFIEFAVGVQEDVM